MGLSELPNIGKQLEADLGAIGVYTKEELLEIGSVEAVLRLGISGNACYNKLYALEGAIKGIRWHHLSRDEKDDLKEKYDNCKQ